jgi:DegV family protein with EDD domain
VTQKEYVMRIVADSSCDLIDELKERMDITLVPLTITVGDKHFKDDESLDVDQMLRAIEGSEEVPRSACPSPQDFMNAFMEKGSVFVVTLTAALSGTYNSAILAKDLFLQEQQEKFIHIFDSKGSSVKETLIALKVNELIRAGLSEHDIVSEVNTYIEKMKYFFQLGSLDIMIKNGRISKFKGIIGGVLNIKPILYATPSGEAELFENVRSEKRSVKRLVEIVGEQCHDFSDRILAISHCYAPEKAEKLKQEIEERYNFKEVFIVPTRGLTSLYTSRGGITIAF